MNHDPRGKQKAKAHPNPTPQPLTFPVDHIPIAAIDQGEQLIRDDPNDPELDELAYDIQRHGLLQPIGVRPAAGGRYQLLWGGRRLAATRKLRWSSIPARLYDDATQTTRSVALRENLLRQQLTLREECDAINHMHLQENLSPDQIADLTSHSRDWVLRRLAIPHLPTDTRTALLEGRIPLAHAEAISSVDEPEARAYLLQTTQQHRLTLAQLHHLIETWQATPSVDAAVNDGVARALDPHLQTTLTAACFLCGTQRPLDSLQTIRVCQSDCPCLAEPHDVGAGAKETPNA